MAYVDIEGYVCDRCGYRWAPRNGTGRRDKNDPKVCAKCKSPYWNKARKNKLDQERWANRWIRQDRDATIPKQRSFPANQDAK